MKARAPRRTPGLAGLGLVVLGLAGAGALLGACALAPYQHATVELPAGLPADAFDRAVDVVRVEFPKLAVRDPAGFRLQSQWRPEQDHGAAARRRLTMWREAGRLCAVVEVQYLRPGLVGAPQWTPIEGDTWMERAILDRVLAGMR